ncbi:MAG: hypothetical protein EAY68_04235, partial [Bacteroidetes bacterium]
TPTAGFGSITLIGGTTSTYAGGFASGSRALNTSTYPAASASSGTAGIQIAVSTVGVSNVIFGWNHRHSGSSSRFAKVQYTLDGTNYQPFDLTPTNCTGISSNSNIDYTNDVFLTTAQDIWTYRTINFSGITGANNNANFAVRIVSVFDPAGTNYVATGGGTYATTGTWRFDDIEFSQGATLPISLQQFTVTGKAGKALLTWLSNSEINAREYQVQASTDGSNYSTVSTVLAKGNNSRYEAEIAVQGTTFFRLKMLDKDGTFSYSGVQVLLVNDTKKLSVYPTVVKQQAVVTTLPVNQPTVLVVHNASGQQVKQLSVPANTQQISINCGDLVGGNYTITQWVNSENVQAKFIKL